VQNTRARLDDNSGHSNSTSNAERPTSNPELPYHSERSRECSSWGRRDIDEKAKG